MALAIAAPSVQLLYGQKSHPIRAWGQDEAARVYWGIWCPGGWVALARPGSSCRAHDRVMVVTIASRRGIAQLQTPACRTRLGRRPQPARSGPFLGRRYADDGSAGQRITGDTAGPDRRHQ